MTQTVPLSPYEHAARLRFELAASIAQAIEATLARYSDRQPANPWHLDSHPSRPDVEAALDALFASLVCMPTSAGHPTAFPSRTSLAILGFPTS